MKMKIQLLIDLDYIDNSRLQPNTASKLLNFNNNNGYFYEDEIIPRKSEVIDLRFIDTFSVRKLNEVLDTMFFKVAQVVHQPGCKVYYYVVPVTKEGLVKYPEQYPEIPSNPYLI